MSKYYVNKFLFMTDRDPEHLKRYIEDPRSFVATWEQSIGPKLLGNDVEASTVLAFTDAEREALQMALRASDGSRERAAEALDISPTTLWRKMTRLGITFESR